MMFSNQGKDIAAFRDRTERNAGKMIGACFLTFKCPECNKVKPTKGRKSRGHKAGFRCAECVSK